MSVSAVSFLCLKRSFIMVWFVSMDNDKLQQSGEFFLRLKAISKVELCGMSNAENHFNEIRVENLSFDTLFLC